MFKYLIENRKEVKPVIVVLMAIYGTLQTMPWIESTALTIVNWLSLWIHPMMCVDPHLWIAVYLIKAGVFACVLFVKIILGLYMTL